MREKKGVIEKKRERSKKKRRKENSSTAERSGMSARPRWSAMKRGSPLERRPGTRQTDKGEKSSVTSERELRAELLMRISVTMIIPLISLRLLFSSSITEAPRGRFRIIHWNRQKEKKTRSMTRRNYELIYICARRAAN